MGKIEKKKYFVVKGFANPDNSNTGYHAIKYGTKEKYTSIAQFWFGDNHDINMKKSLSIVNTVVSYLNKKEKHKMSYADLLNRVLKNKTGLKC